MTEKLEKPEVISTEKIYEGKIFDVYAANIRHGEAEYKREIVNHKGSAVIVPVFADNKVAMIRQYRYAVEDFLLEIPAGRLDDGETPEIAAARELEEEIGVRADTIEKLTEFYVSPGFLTEKMFIYLATGLHEGEQNLEEDEILEVERLSFPEAFEKIRSGEIQDAKSIVGLIFAGERFGFRFSSPTVKNGFPI